MKAAWLEAMLNNERAQKEIRVGKVTRVHSEPAVPKGENFMGSVHRVSTDLVLTSGETLTLRFILKEIVPSEARGDIIRESGVFRTEIEVYNQVLHRMKRLMKAACDTRETIWPNLEYFRPYDMIILEDLRAKGFNTINRKFMLDLDHSNLVLQELGRFHAMSLALIKNGEIDPNQFNDMVFFRDQFLNLRFSNALHPLAHALENNWGDAWRDVGRRIHDIKEGLELKLRALTQFEDPRFKVLNHGDCWTSNLMFKHDASGKPSQVKLIDFQLVHYNSFAFDLTYLLYSCVRPDVRRSQFDRLLGRYRASLVDNMTLFGVDASSAPSDVEVRREMNRLRFYGFILLTSVFAMTTADNEDLDIEELAKDLKQATAFRQRLFASERFINNVSDDIRMFAAEGVI